MRRQVSLLVAVVSTAIVVAFVIPLLGLVATLAADRGLAAASQQAASVAVLVSSLQGDPRLEALAQPSLSGSTIPTSVVLADQRVIGAPWPDANQDPDYQRAQSGEAFTIRDSVGGRVYVPVLVDGGVAVVRTTITADQLADGVLVAWVGIIALGLVLSGVAILVAAQVGRRVSRPLLAVTQTAHQLRGGDLSARAPTGGTWETVELASALNGLAERIEQLLADERDNVRALAHRLRTPVTALRLEVEQLADPGQRQVLEASVLQLQAAIDDIVREARRPLREDLLVACDPVEVVAARVDYWRPLAEDQGREVRARLSQQSVRVGISALNLADVLDICIDNVFAHTPEGTGFEVTAEVAGKVCTVTISDDGPGFSDLGESRRQGTSGLGLQIARRLVEQASGRLTLPQPGSSPTRVVIELGLQPQ